MPEAVGRGHPSPPEEVQIAIAAAIAALTLEGLKPGEVQARQDWKSGDTERDHPYLGITVHPLGERLANGVIGWQHVAYPTGVTIVVPKDRSSKLKSDPTLLYHSVIRRRFHNRRIPVGDLTAGVQKHVCLVEDGRPRIPKGGKFDEVDVDQLIILPWVQELPDPGE